MQHITRDRKTFLRWGQRQDVPTATEPDDGTVYQHQGVDYKILPLERFKVLIRRWTAYEIGCFTIGAAMVAFCGGYTFGGAKIPAVVDRIVTIEKPIVIEKQVPINAGCIAFCNR
jgi:hypothetical protein